MKKEVQKPVKKPLTKKATRSNQLSHIVDRFKSFQSARVVLHRVRSVPTIFPQLDHATGVCGLPIDRFMLVHGPSNNGKTVLANGLLLSFLMKNHYALLIDAEHTTPITWLEQLMGEYADNPRFFALRPKTYEETVDRVREFVNLVAAARASGDEPEDTTALIVVDSIRKLVPSNLLEKIAKGTEKGGVDGMSGRGAQIKAAMNAAWLDELIPLLASTGTAMLAIARESEDMDADQWAKKSGWGFKINGGKSIVYDSSLVMRCELAGHLYKGAAKEESGTRNQAIGEKIRVTITKTKIAQKEDRYTVCYFNLSNGTETPPGFDTSRDIVELAEKFGVLVRSGAWYAYKGTNVGQGLFNTVKYFADNLERRNEMEGEVRLKFTEVAPLEHDQDGVVIS